MRTLRYSKILNRVQNSLSGSRFDGWERSWSVERRWSGCLTRWRTLHRWRLIRMHRFGRRRCRRLHWIFIGRSSWWAVILGGKAGWHHHSLIRYSAVHATSEMMVGAVRVFAIRNKRSDNRRRNSTQLNTLVIERNLLARQTRRHIVDDFGLKKHNQLTLAHLCVMSAE